jgi:YD repeat-containing protein
MGHVTKHEYYGATAMGGGAYPGKLKMTTAPGGLKTLVEYDVFGRTAKTTSAYGTEAAVSAYQRFNWCSSGARSCRDGATYYTTQFSDGGSPVYTELDMLGRTLRKGSKNIEGRTVVVDYDFDHMGNNVAVTDPYFAGETPLSTQVRYDTLGRVTQSTDASGRVDLIKYEGLTQTAIMDDGGKAQTKTEVRNSLDNLMSVTDNAGQTVTYEYDSMGRQTKVIDPHNNQISITYNVLGQKTRMVDPDKGTWTYTYNGLGQLITQRDAKGQTTCMAYDKLGRQIKRVDLYRGGVASSMGQNSQAHQGCAGSGGATTTWSYHTTGPAVGQLAAVNYGGYSESYSYDSYGRAVASNTTIEGQTFNVQTQYDHLSRPYKVTYPESGGGHARLVVQTKYNALGFATGTYSGDGTQLYSRPEAVDVLGNVTQSRQGNGVVTNRSYDLSTGYLQTIKARASIAIVPENIQDLSVNFDALGNLTSRHDTATNFDETFVYDNMNRLTTVNSNFGNGFVTSRVTYDALGNITHKGGVGSYSYGSSSAGCQAGPHAVSRIAPASSRDKKNATYCYDANGNNITGDGRTLAYNSFDKPSRISKGANSTSMRYGADRQLVYRDDVTHVNGSRTHSTSRLLGGLFERVDHVEGRDAGKVELRFYIGGAIVTQSYDVSGNASRNAPNSRTRYTHTDHLGSIVAITDELGLVSERLSFDA